MRASNSCASLCLLLHHSSAPAASIGSDIRQALSLRWGLLSFLHLLMPSASLLCHLKLASSSLYRWHWQVRCFQHNIQQICWITKELRKCSSKKAFSKQAFSCFLHFTHQYSKSLCTRCVLLYSCVTHSQPGCLWLLLEVRSKEWSWSFSDISFNNWTQSTWRAGFLTEKW